MNHPDPHGPRDSRATGDAPGDHGADTGDDARNDAPDAERGRVITRDDASPEPPRPGRRRVRAVRAIPSLLTLGNGMCGFGAIVLVSHAGDATGGLVDPRVLWLAAWLVVAGMILDAFDGAVARLTRSAGEFGAQLDSLCDAVTFGVAPAFLASEVVYALEPTLSRSRIVVICMLYVACTLIRLARFNVETDESPESHRTFSGLPSPAAAGVIAGAVLFWSEHRTRRPDEWLPGFDWLEPVVAHIPQALPFAAGVLGLLMVSRVPYAHLAQRMVSDEVDTSVFVLLLFLGALLVFFSAEVLSAGFLLYALSGPLLWGLRRVAGAAGGDDDEDGLL